MCCHSGGLNAQKILVLNSKHNVYYRYFSIASLSKFQARSKMWRRYGVSVKPEFVHLLLTGSHNWLLRTCLHICICNISHFHRFRTGMPLWLGTRPGSQEVIFGVCEMSPLKNGHLTGYKCVSLSDVRWNVHKCLLYSRMNLCVWVWAPTWVSVLFEALPEWPIYCADVLLRWRVGKRQIRSSVFIFWQLAKKEDGHAMV